MEAVEELGEVDLGRLASLVGAVDLLESLVPALGVLDSPGEDLEPLFGRMSSFSVVGT